MWAVVLNNFTEIVAMGACILGGGFVGRKTAGIKFPRFKRS